jgi:hypothetical protein
MPSLFFSRFKEENLEMSPKLCAFAMHTLCLRCSIELSSISGVITPHLVPTKMVRSTTDRCAVVPQGCSS